ncbi:MAG: universal stress protein [Candidatus Syntrophonatronum acetioxidans]|uniref:Universal stress protein n=1 Tax=Candidatus Syntrophonatronum acetioxidans TaxID=1795816 RepID=A0A424YIB1_9FIRM|nr:MAG: universal stress protein [Candidatus Syntrophonatronum acetioxidans]
MFKKIVIASDFSLISDQLLEDITQFKDKGLEEVIILHVLPEGKKGERLKEKSLRKLEKREKLLVDEGIRVRAILKKGVPAFHIKEVTEEEGGDLVMIGTRGHNPLRDFFIGSTALTYIRIATKPTLVIKEKKRKRDMPRRGFFTRPIVPVDFSKYSDNVIKWTLKQDISNYVEEYLLLHVWAVRDDVRDDKESKAKWKEYARQRLEDMKKDYGSRKVKAEVFLRGGFPITQVKELVEDKGASMVIMATRGMGHVIELPIGSIAEGIVREVELPILLLPRVSLI